VVVIVTDMAARVERHLDDWYGQRGDSLRDTMKFIQQNLVGTFEWLEDAYGYLLLDSEQVAHDDEAHPAAALFNKQALRAATRRSVQGAQLRSRTCSSRRPGAG
jgi:hypothetical protein